MSAGAYIDFPTSVWRDAILLLAAGPFVYYVVGLVAALRFFRRERVQQAQDFTPPVSILKPVRGVDEDAYANFASFCRLDYPSYEILFAVAVADDPVLPLLEKVRLEDSGGMLVSK